MGIGSDPDWEKPVAWSKIGGELGKGEYSDQIKLAIVGKVVWVVEQIRLVLDEAGKIPLCVRGEECGESSPIPFHTSNDPIPSSEEKESKNLESNSTDGNYISDHNNKKISLIVSVAGSFSHSGETSRSSRSGFTHVLVLF